MNTPIIIIIALSYLFSGCGSDQGDAKNAAQTGAASNCSNVSFIGTWNGVTVPTDTLSLNANCQGTSSYCASQFTFTPIKTNGQVMISIATTNGNAFCGAPGTYNCAINATEPNLTLDCGGGAVDWTR